MCTHKTGNCVHLVCLTPLTTFPVIDLNIGLCLTSQPVNVRIRLSATGNHQLSPLWSSEMRNVFVCACAYACVYMFMLWTLQQQCEILQSFYWEPQLFASYILGDFNGTMHWGCFPAWDHNFWCGKVEQVFHLPTGQWQKCLTLKEATLSKVEPKWRGQIRQCKLLIDSFESASLLRGSKEDELLIGWGQRVQERLGFLFLKDFLIG